MRPESPGTPVTCWPTPLQELLLQATVLSGAEAKSAWDRWRSLADFDSLDQGSNRLLPETYTNLVANDIDDPLLGRMKGLTRRTWLENQLLFHQGAAVLAVFENLGITTMITKGPALVLRHYLDHGRRPMADFDVVVPTDKRDEACDGLDKAGYHRILADGEASRPFNHAATFVNDKGRQFDVHWHVMYGCSDSSPFWDDATPVMVNTTPTLAPSPSDLFLHVCVHGIRPNPVPPIRWVVDAAMLVKSAEFDWRRLVTMARRYRYSYRIGEAVRFLIRLGVPIPDDVLGTLSQPRVSRLERREFERVSGASPKSVETQFASSWLSFLRYTGEKASISNFRRLPRYLQESWSADSIWAVPGLAATKTARRLFQRPAKRRH